MKFNGTLLVVQDLERSKHFYMELMGCKVTEDFGANITFDNAFSLQTLESWSGFIHRAPADVRFAGNDAELYFEGDDFDGFVKKLESWPMLEYVHPVQEHSWGQRGVRFYDPDRHVIEVGESMRDVCLRFRAQGMTNAQVAARMDVDAAYVARWLEENFA